jgi:hypothetical protein
MIADPTGLNVTTLSVNGHMEFGVITNAAVAAAAPIARACAAAYQELSKPAPRGRGTRRPRPDRTGRVRT